MCHAKDWTSPCSLEAVLFNGQFANTSSATHVRLFLPCSRKVQSSRDCSSAFCVSSLIPLHGGILYTRKNIRCFPNMSHSKQLIQQHFIYQIYKIFQDLDKQLLMRCCAIIQANQQQPNIDINNLHLLKSVEVAVTRKS